MSSSGQCASAVSISFWIVAASAGTHDGGFIGDLLVAGRHCLIQAEQPSQIEIASDVNLQFI